jgi:hypothetical protein
MNIENKIGNVKSNLQQIILELDHEIIGKDDEIQRL